MTIVNISQIWLIFFPFFLNKMNDFKDNRNIICNKVS